MKKDSKKNCYVTKKNIRDWCWLVAGVHPTDRNFDSYVRNWHVHHKVMRAKLTGNFDLILRKARHPVSMGRPLKMVIKSNYH